MDDITKQQPVIVVKLPNELHTISIVQIRQLAAGVVWCIVGIKML